MLSTASPAPSCMAIKQENQAKESSAIEYLESLMSHDTYARMVIAALRNGAITEQQAIVQYMNIQKQRADHYESELIKIAQRATSVPPVFNP
ncbi:TPA: hypothetical protein PIU23_003527 [Klebsiella quasipneumoniae subsp. similipneumoniae]|nr:hypothetical protein [Klebsiella quasipneumoniae]HDH1380246.1 hypothetical protein [Klebsiella quasipneumoniae subsp. similipneumoniae]HDU4846318.1 hypothetical protein [Klebsiella quasipneumoniae subsp. similipneumoniae]